ncbi:MAG: peptidoglycan DD-metalloendopeptidase family protein [Actinomycetota bacterium]
MRLTPVVAAASVALFAGAVPAARASTGWLIPPVDAPIERAFVAPSHAYGRGHRGIDYGVAPGTAVRAAGNGTVTFAGSVGGLLAVAISHEGGIKTTYSFLSEVYVRSGESVAQGRWIGRSGNAHQGAEEGLHFGVKAEGDYVDPTDYLGPLDASRAVHLAPLGDTSGCETPPDLSAARSAPNDNVAVAVAGIGSRTRGELSADMYEHGPELLGYPEERIYRFSYRGRNGYDLHEPYDRTDTYGNLRDAAARLRELLLDVAERHPGRDVDLIAHSQGGIVARVFLEGLAQNWDRLLPRVEHLVTLATPHTGAPLAGAIEDLEEETLTGRLLVDGVAAWAQRGGPIPNPRSAAVAQLAPGSGLLEWLATEDVLYGTRALALTMPHDAVVPASRARLEEETNRVVGPEGLNAHEAIVRSPSSRRLVHAFLRDAAPSCEGAWDRLGPWAGGAISWLEGNAGRAYGGLEDAALKGAGRAVSWLTRTAGRLVRASDPRRW